MPNLHRCQHTDYQILNFGMSDNFQKVDFAHLPFPAEYLIDYVRVYQRPGIGAMGCDPADHPTAQYIADHANAYANPNLTTWEQAGYTFPVCPFPVSCGYRLTE